MNINKAIEELDLLFAQKRVSEVEDFLKLKLKEADDEDDISSVITLVNELIGFYRSASRFSDALVYCDYIISLMEQMELQGTIPFATTLLNVATAMRAAGKLERSLEHYNDVLRIYDEKLPADDYRFASLYNNMSLLYQEMKQYDKACECLEKALAIITKHEGLGVETAVTHTNLGMSLLKLEKVREAIEHINESLKIFEAVEGAKDFHYSSALAAMGEAQYKLKNYESSIKYYLQSLEETKANIGKNISYAITCRNLSMVYEELGRTEESKKYMAESKSVLEKIKK